MSAVPRGLRKKGMGLAAKTAIGAAAVTSVGAAGLAARRAAIGGARRIPKPGQQQRLLAPGPSGPKLPALKPGSSPKPALPPGASQGMKALPPGQKGGALAIRPSPPSVPMPRGLRGKAKAGLSQGLNNLLARLRRGQGKRFRKS